MADLVGIFLWDKTYRTGCGSKLRAGVAQVLVLVSIQQAKQLYHFFEPQPNEGVPLDKKPRKKSVVHRVADFCWPCFFVTLKKVHWAKLAGSQYISVFVYHNPVASLLLIELWMAIVPHINEQLSWLGVFLSWMPNPRRK